MQSYLFWGVWFVLLIEVFSKKNLKTSRNVKKIKQQLTEACQRQISASDCIQKDQKGKSQHDIPFVNVKFPQFPEDSIFFIDTSCEGYTGRSEACAVAAAAQAHPNRAINIIITRSANKKSIKKTLLGETLHKFANVFLYRIEFKTYFKNTSLEKMNADQLHCLINLFPEVLGYVTLFNFGGIYLDWNMLVARSFGLLPTYTNMVGKIDDTQVGAGIIALSKFGHGHKFAKQMIRRYKEIFYSGDWEVNDTSVITVAMEKMCGTSVRKMSAATCEHYGKSIEVYTPNFFYPLHYDSWPYYFLYSQDQIPPDAFAFYVWNSRSYNKPLYWDSLYGRLIEKFCPQNVRLLSELRTLFVP